MQFRSKESHAKYVLKDVQSWDHEQLIQLISKDPNLRGCLSFIPSTVPRPLRGLQLSHALKQPSLVAKVDALMDFCSITNRSVASEIIAWVESPFQASTIIYTLYGQVQRLSC